MKKKLKILLSAYACEPNIGSEQEVAWMLANSLSQNGHDVSVITRLSNKKAIEKSMLKKKLKINFIYFDYPNWILNIISRKGKRNFLSFLYFFLWQVGIFFAIKPYLKKIKFDYIHHVTYVTFRYPSFLSLYKIPFIFGPLGGGEKSPSKLRKDFTFVEKIIEYMRDVSNFYCKFSPTINLTYLNSFKILTTTEESRKIVPSIYHKKTSVLQAIGVEKFLIKKFVKKKKKKPITICYAGRFLSWKGLHIILKTFSIINKKRKDINLVLIGDGPIKNVLKKKVRELNIDKNVVFTGPIKRNKVFNYFKQSHIIFYPSLRDSGGFVVLEGMRYSVIATCNLGGPGHIANKRCAIVEEAIGKDQNEISKSFAKSIINLIDNKKLYNIKRLNSLKTLSKYTMDKKIKKIYS